MNDLVRNTLTTTENMDAEHGIELRVAYRTFIRAYVRSLREKDAPILGEKEGIELKGHDHYA